MSQRLRGCFGGGEKSLRLILRATVSNAPAEFFIQFSKKIVYILFVIQVL